LRCPFARPGAVGDSLILRAGHPLSKRLGIYVDDVYRVVVRAEGRRISTNRAFLLFACEVGRRFDALVLFGRTLHSDEPADYLLPSDVELAELPHYSQLSELRQLLKALAGTSIGMWRGLGEVDTVWVFGPHPFALLLVTMSFIRRKRVVLGVRQDTLKYFHARLRSWRWLPVLIAVWGMDRTYRLLARIVPTTVVGPELARLYGGDNPLLLPMTVSLVRAIDVAEAPPKRDWSRTLEVLTVSRLEPEKNPLLLVEALARLERERPDRYHLTWVGRGRLERHVRTRAAELGVADHLKLCGYVPFGPELLKLYRRAHIFAHVSLTEGVPQVLIEALAIGTPIVATNVGGVSAILDHGQAGLLVPPRDLDAIYQALCRISDDEQLRDGLVVRGLQLARELILEAEAGRVAAFLGTDQMDET
jgi:glycosyltransferase involved in cell wall biosynthesis